MDTSNELADIAEGLIDGTGLYVNITIDNEIKKIYDTENTYIQFGYLSKPNIAPSEMWSMMDGGRQVDSWGGLWDQYADRGGIRVMSELTLLPDDVDEATSVMKEALAVFRNEIAENENVVVDKLRKQLTEKAAQTRDVYLDALGTFRKELDDDGGRVYTNEEAEEMARAAANLGFAYSESPCVYVEHGKMVAWDWDPRSARYSDEPWDVITVEIDL